MMLAYWDTFSGLIPCRITGATPGESGTGMRLAIEITAARGPYRRGETLETSALFVVPRDRVRRRRWSTSILPYRWSDYGVTA